MAANKQLHNHYFYENVTTIDQVNTGDTWIVSTAPDISTIILGIKCTGTFSLQILSTVFDIEDDANYHPHPYLKRTYTWQEGTEYIDSADFNYEIDVTGVDFLKVKLISLSGTLTCKGKCVG